MYFKSFRNFFTVRELLNNIKTLLCLLVSQQTWYRFGYNMLLLKFLVKISLHEVLEIRPSPGTYRSRRFERVTLRTFSTCCSLFFYEGGPSSIQVRPSLNRLCHA